MFDHRQESKSDPFVHKSPHEIGFAMGEALARKAADLDAAKCRFLLDLAEFDKDDRWGHSHCKSCAHWLSWRCGMTLADAREDVRVARSLGALPKITKAFSTGRISFSKVRTITRVATPENEDLILACATEAPASQTAKIVGLYRRTLRIREREMGNKVFDERYLSKYFDRDGALVFRGKLPGEQGALLNKALEAGAEAVYKRRKLGFDPNSRPTGDQKMEQAPGEHFNPISANQADALVMLAESYMSTGPVAVTGSDRNLVVIHVDPQALSGRHSQRCELENEVPLDPGAARRIACDSSVVRVTKDQNGSILDVGRRTRTISPALRRALQLRDSGCRFPGCSNKRFTDGHHIKFWSQGGHTKLDNLVQLCRFHHRLVHEGNFTVVRRRDGRFKFKRPDGTPVLSRPDPARKGKAERISKENKELGLNITSETGKPNWWGEHPDYGVLIEGLEKLDGVSDRFEKCMEALGDDPEFQNLSSKLRVQVMRRQSAEIRRDENQWESLQAEREIDKLKMELKDSRQRVLSR